MPKPAYPLSGSKLKSFILCPPKPIDIQVWGLAPRGTRLIEIEDVWHIFDIVSKADYRVADYVEETRCKGASRWLSIKLDFSKLSEGSRLVLIHAQAIIENYNEYPLPLFVCCPLDIHVQLPNQPGEARYHRLSINPQYPKREISYAKKIQV